MLVVQIEHLTKKYKDKVAVNDVSLTIKEGERYGIIGPNGAGKTSTIKSICGISSFDSGSIRIFGKDIQKHGREIKKQIGVVPQEIAVFEDLTAYENVHFFAKLYGVSGKLVKEKVKQALEFTGLYEKRKDLPKTFSGGMKRRLNIACSIVHEPKLLVMDEPTVGIDAQSRNHILNSIKKLNERGTTIIYTSHYMKEVEEICTRICILDHGVIELEGSYDEIKKDVFLGQKLIFTLTEISPNILKNLMEYPEIESCEFDDLNLVITCRSMSGDILEEINKIVNRNNSTITNINIEEVSLEGVYLKITGEGIRD
ncbi:ABC transporter ATP-binding protein [Lysinibacillus xylanilyticus]|uniref:ABC transporter ATP-binding protein n=1 Tax=Lysinibacillus xylanilyticus TaxID=582475 RepID=UPI002B255963|nr:ABC transporter ATP-binding protein [Lysinibacillus xylanilyticus]MEB2302394.1 ABC transporter ATP-binding protein [Lysinibacillus xylanilyticus]